jgi:hypothetical protein
MSDEPKQRSQARIGWAALALLVVYPLSSGPALWAGANFEPNWIMETYSVVYRSIGCTD